VVVFWNDHNPEADVIVLAGQPRKFLGVASYVQKLPRFDATPEQRAEEKARKRAALLYARTEARAIQPECQRAARPVPCDAGSDRIGAEIRAAEARAEEKMRETRSLDRLVRNTDVCPEDLALERDRLPAAAYAATIDELKEL
jgi:hypothetical protein